MADRQARRAVRLLRPLVGDRVWWWLRVRAGRTTPHERRARRLRAMDLTQLGRHFGTDKAAGHGYTRHYQRHLEHLRDREFTLLEIGVGGYSKVGRGGASLRMWRWFFPRARIVGLDLEDKSFVDAGRVRTVVGSQTDEAVLRRIVAEEGAPLVVVDDGSHQPAHIRATFALLFPLLPEGAVYAIEDTQTSYWPRWGGSLDRHEPTTTMGLVKDLVDGLNHRELLEDHRPTYADEHVVAVHCYRNLVILEKGDNRRRPGPRPALDRERAWARAHRDEPTGERAGPPRADPPGPRQTHPAPGTRS